MSSEQRTDPREEEGRETKTSVLVGMEERENSRGEVRRGYVGTMKAAGQR